MNRISYILIFLWCLGLILRAQYRLDSEYLTVENGLSQNGVSAVIKDSKGFLWIGTMDGLNRFDGVNIQIFRNNPLDSLSISGDQIMSLMEDVDGNIWVGTYYRGISKFDRRNFVFKNYRTAAFSDSSHNITRVTKIVCDGEGRIFAKAEVGLLKMDVNRDEFKVLHSPVEVPKNCSINSFSLTSEKTLTVLYNHAGLFSLNTETNQFSSIPDPHRFFREQLFSGPVKWTRNRILVSADRNIYSYDLEANSVKLIASFDFPITTFSSEAEGIIWIGSYDMKLYTIEEVGKHLEVVDRSMVFTDLSKVSTIRTFFCADDGITWIGSNGAGLWRIVQARQKFRLLRIDENSSNSLHNASIRCILPISDNRILIGGYSGLEEYNFKSKQSVFWIERANATEKFIPYSFLRDDSEANLIWIGTEGGGLFEFNTETRTHSRVVFPGGFYANFIQTMLSYQKDSFLLGTYLGIKRFNKSTREISSDSWLSRTTEGISIQFLFRDKDGYLWCGTRTNGIIILNERNSTQKSIDLSNGGDYLNRNNVVAINQAKDANIWASTGGGLVNLSTEGKLKKTYTTADGLSNNNVYAVLIDKLGIIWMSTNNGISRFDPETNIFTNYTTADGLQSKEFNRNAYASYNDSLMFFGGIRGVNYFDSENLSEKKLAYDVFIEKIGTSKNTVKVEQVGASTETYEFDYSDDEIIFSYSCPIFINPNETDYYYKLKGFKDIWRKTESETVGFQNLDPGDYKFQIIRTTNDNIETEKITSVSFKIVPPFYLTVWFKTMGILFFIFVGPSIYFYRVRILVREKKRSKQFSQQLLSAQEEERKKIAYILHDSIAQQALSLKMLINTAYKQMSKNQDPEELINEATGIAEDILKEVRTISHTMHPHTLDKLGLRKSVESAARQLSVSSGIQFIVEMDGYKSNMKTERKLILYRIIQELFNNVVKHSRAKVCRVVYFESKDERIFEVSDDGIGFDNRHEESGSFGLGLESIRERAALIGAIFEITSSVGSGTSVKIIFHGDGKDANFDS